MLRIRTNFTKEEIEFIKSKFGIIHTSEIANLLNRSLSSIQNKTFRMGLKLSEEAKNNLGKPIKIGMLTILKRDYTKKGRFRYFWFLCDCGNKVSRILSDVRRGRGMSSCGCYQSKIKWKDEGESQKHHRFLAYKHKAAEKGIIFTITEQEFLLISSIDCCYCGAKPKKVNPYAGKDGKPYNNRVKQISVDRAWYKMNGIDRKIPDNGYVIDNCLPCCFPCNRAKSNMSYEEFIEYLDVLVNFRITALPVQLAQKLQDEL